MIGPGSLSFRLLAGALLWIAAALVVTGLALSELFREHSAAQFVQRLEASLNELAAAVALDAAGRPVLSRPLSQPQFRKPYSGYYWQVSSVGGEAILRSRSLWDQALAVPADELLDGALHRHRLAGPDGAPVSAVERVVSLPGSEERLRLLVAENAAFLDASTRQFERILRLSLGVLGLGLALAALAQVAVGLRPLKRLRGGLAAVRAGDSRHLAGRFPEEVQPLVDDLNALLDQNATMIERARTQAGNLAHALKTPLAVLANEAGTLAARGEHETAERLRRYTEQMQRQIDYQLARARAAAAQRVPGARTAVAASAEALARTLRQVYRARDLDIRVAVPPGLAFRGERQDLEEMLGNLLDNACKWARRQVRVSAALEGERLVVRIDDDGPGLPAARRAEVFDRGRRLDEATAGAGLGLSIVRDLAELYGGGVALSDSDLGGLRVALDLPAGGAVASRDDAAPPAG